MNPFAGYRVPYVVNLRAYDSKQSVQRAEAIPLSNAIGSNQFPVVPPDIFGLDLSQQNIVVVTGQGNEAAILEDINNGLLEILVADNLPKHYRRINPSHIQTYAWGSTNTGWQVK